MQTSRRRVLQLGAALAAGGHAPAGAAKKKVPVALQLYSLRDDCKADIARTVAAVGKMQFAGVEFYGWGGYFDLTAAQLRRMLDDHGLKSVSDHISPAMLRGDRFERTVEFHHTLGTRMVVMSSLDGSREAQATAKFWRDSGRMAAETAARLKPHGIRLGFHNHPGEFAKLPGGGIPWELFFDATGQDVLQQLDLGSVLRAGADPAAYLKRYPGRTATMHMKDYSPSNDKVLIGEGGMNWRQVIDLAETVGGIEWYILEQESYPYHPLESVARSYDNLKRLLAQRA